MSGNNSPEQSAAREAVGLLETGDARSAQEKLRTALRYREGENDQRSPDDVRLRAHLELAIVELEHNLPDHALRSLRLGLK